MISETTWCLSLQLLAEDVNIAEDVLCAQVFPKKAICRQEKCNDMIGYKPTHFW